MDNITHSLVGVALVDLAGDARSIRASRRAIVAAGVLAANAPDLDLFYTWITPAPLGYLLHHRGHSHTLAGLIVLAVVLTGAFWRWRNVQELDVDGKRALLLVIVLGLISHLLLDAFNNYGVHPFYPLNSRWYYGDAVFIFEPWLWLLFGVAAAWNARNRVERAVFVSIAAVLPALAVLTGIVPRSALIGFALGGGLWTWWLRGLPAWARAATAFGATVCFLIAMTIVAGLARTRTREALQGQLRGELADIVLTPSPSSPLCWSVIAIEAASANEFVLWRGTLSLQPHWRSPGDCALRRLLQPSNERMAGDHLLLRDEIRQPMQPLRDLAGRDCWSRAWLQFGRAPVLDNGQLSDLRFTERVGPGFTTMRVSSGIRACPAYLTRWEMPRRDLLALDAR
jgi:inner membrane protein